MCFSLETTHGSKYEIYIESSHRQPSVLKKLPQLSRDLPPPLFCRAFVNNVWYIKILSPEDVQKMGKQGVESGGFSPNTAQRMNSSGSEDRELVSGLPSAGYLEY